MGTILAYFGSYLFFFNTAVFRAPVIPLLLLFAAYGIWRWFQFLAVRDVVGATRWGLGALVLCYLTSVPLATYQSPGPVVWRCRQADLRLMKAQFELAERESRAALALNDRSADAWRLLGRALVRQNRLPEAVAALRAGVGLVPKSADLQIELGDRVGRHG